jgi:hypothetical protein
MAPSTNSPALVGPREHNRIVRTALAAVVTVLAVLGTPPAHADDPTPSPPTPYQVPTQDGPVLPGNQILPPVCAHAMQACGFDYDPATGTWRPRGGG